jgi:sugar lactone lactonase YvrE
VFAYDLNSAKLLRKVMLPADGKPHFLNAMTIDRSGNLYVCDSGTAGIYRLSRNASTLEPLIPPDLFRATQGLAFSNDEKILFVVDYTDGLWALDLATQKRGRVEAPPDTWLGGLDGLTSTADGFVAVQIGIKPERVLRFKVDSAGEHITNVRVLEMNHPDYAGPIQGSANNTHFFYVANSQLALGNAQTGEFATDKAKPTVVLRLPL